jgi:hypothetical protein
MAIITTGNNTSEPRLFISTYYALINQKIFFKFEVPTSLNTSNNIKTIKINTGESNLSTGVLNSLILDLDPNTPQLDNVTYAFTQIGSYYINYEITYVNGTKKTYYLETPIKILNEWPTFSQEDIRILGENILELPYTFDQIKIGPNEFGVHSVYNDSIQKLHNCLEYLKSNTRVLNSKTPSLYYGWVGVNSSLIADGLCWHTVDYRKDFYLNPSGSSLNKGFSELIDMAETNELLFTLDKNSIRIFKKSNKLFEINFKNKIDILNTFTKIISFDITDDGKILFVLDSIQNKLYRIDIDYDFTNSIYELYEPMFSLTYNIGSYGDEIDPFTFNNPIQVLYKNDNVYVLDYNNKCIKNYNKNLDWVFTYKNDIFDTDTPISIAVQTDSSFLYVLTKSTIYIFNYKSNIILSKIDISNLITLNPVKIFFDNSGEFFYIITNNETSSSVFKYTALGLYMDNLDIPLSLYVSGKSGINKDILLNNKNSLIKCQEVTDILETGEGLQKKYWGLDQIVIKSEEFNQDLVINRVFSRLVNNIINFKNSLESKLDLTTESTPAGLITYFRLTPILSDQRPYLGNDIENNNVFVGVNELHTPSVINREFKKIYDSLILLKNFLNIDVVSISSETGREIDKCLSPFCWSWKAMSTYKLTKPMIRACNINPISFKELRSEFPTDYPTVINSENQKTVSKSWINAKSTCCEAITTPLL